MANTIKHLGVVDNIEGVHIKVKILQATACATCSAKGFCTSIGGKEKFVDVIDKDASSYQVGEQVMIEGETFMGMVALLLAFVLPFVLLIATLFIFMIWMGNELYAGVFSLGILIPYYYLLWLQRDRLKYRLAFTITPIKQLTI